MMGAKWRKVLEAISRTTEDVITPHGQNETENMNGPTVISAVANMAANKLNLTGQVTGLIGQKH